MKRILTSACCDLLLLTACGEQTPQVEEKIVLPETSGAKAGAYGIHLFNGPQGTRLQERPSAALGLYTTMYLAQGAFIPVKSATLGIAAQQKILAGQTEVESDETFSLLKEFGSILQVDVIDTLNRSKKREEALDTYLRSLGNIMQLAERKINELKELQESTGDLRKAKRDDARQIERTIRQLLDDQEYEEAGRQQELLTTANGEVAELETKEQQVRDILRSYNTLMDIANDRMKAITVNRRVILAGLKVVEVPGIEEFDILETEAFIERSFGGGNSAADPLGTQHIQ